MFYPVPSCVIMRYVSDKQEQQEPQPSKVWFLPQAYFSGLPKDKPPRILMITVFVAICNAISQKYYDDVISQVQFYQLTCPCGLTGCLVGHGYYFRSMKTKGNKVKLRICRVKCKGCKGSHALLLSSFVPYSQIPLADQIDIISGHEEGVELSPIMEQNREIDENNMKAVIWHYRHHWKQKLLSENISLAPVFCLVKKCFSLFKRQFMQNKSTPNILFLETP